MHSHIGCTCLNSCTSLSLEFRCIYSSHNYLDFDPSFIWGEGIVSSPEQSCCLLRTGSYKLELNIGRKKWKWNMSLLEIHIWHFHYHGSVWQTLNRFRIRSKSKKTSDDETSSQINHVMFLRKGVFKSFWIQTSFYLARVIQTEVLYSPLER